MSTRLQHTIISASAGSGKTYQLANRFIALLVVQHALGKMAPERLVAVTFTRKGAGEFADRILTRLAKAAGDKKELQNLRADISTILQGSDKAGGKGLAPGIKMTVDAGTLQTALALLVDNFDRLVLGTIDSFMSRSVQTLAFELGLGGFEILEQPAAELAREELLATVFREAVRRDLQAFHQTIKLATLKSSSSLRREVDQFVRSYHKLLHSLPEEDAWGGTGFWRNSNPGTLAAKDWRAEAKALVELLNGHDWTSSVVREGLVKAAEWLARREPGTASKDVPTWLNVRPEKGELRRGKLLEIWDRWPEVWSCLPKSNSKTPCVVPAEIMQPLRAILQAWLTAETNALSKKTRAIYTLLREYEDHYDQQSRRKGKLSFDDLAFLLAGTGGMTNAVSLLGYRWFQQFDHWLLDEFQDTNRAQWEVLKAWLDEAIQDDTGCKSVFVVGDPKQSIFGWRGGEPRLFQELSEGYPGAFDTQFMVESWRSRPAVLELANQVCDPANNPVLTDSKEFSPASLARWNYLTHKAAPKRTAKPGYAAVLAVEDAVVPAGGDDGENGAEPDKLTAQAAAIKSVLQELKPIERGLTCAILVRKNVNAQAIAQWLRANQITNVMVEGDATLADQSPLVAALVDGLKWLRTPADTLAGQHIQFTPLWKVLCDAALRSSTPDSRTPGQRTNSTSQEQPDPRTIPGSVWRHWRMRLSEAGATGVTNAWCDALREMIGDEYSRYCLRQVTQAAHRLGSGVALADWLAALERLTVRETSSAGSIHIMTIHRAKGLGFDVVFLPDLDLGGANRDPMLLRRDASGVVGGCLLSPPRWLRAWVPELENIKAGAEADQDLEALCVLYVGLTRAKEATFVMVQKEKARNAAAARQWLLGGINSGNNPTPTQWPGVELLWENGDRDSVTPERAGTASNQPAFVAKPEFKLAPPVPRRQRLNPSEAFHSAVGTIGRPSAPDTAGQDLGTAVHAAFEQIEWWNPDQVLAGETNALEAVRKCLAVAPVRALFSPESARDEAFRELPVELLKDNVLWTGVIDRLVLRKDNKGGIRKVLLIDFKSDKVSRAATLQSRYGEQVNLYREGVSAALGVDPSLVEAILVSTHLRDCVPVALASSKGSKHV